MKLESTLRVKIFVTLHWARWEKGMVETCLPFQCNHVEGLWKKKIQKQKERVETDKWKEKGEEEEEEEGGGGETAVEDLAWSETAAEDEGVTGDLCGQPTTSSTWRRPQWRCHVQLRVFLGTLWLEKKPEIFFFFNFLYLLCIRNTLNHKIRNTLKTENRSINTLSGEWFYSNLNHSNMQIAEFFSSNKFTNILFRKQHFSWVFEIENIYSTVLTL